MNKALAAGMVALCAIAGSAAAASQIAVDDPGERGPETIYENVCGYCHGVNVGPIIRGRALPAVLVKSFVRSGPNSMPAFRQTEITDAELDALAAWVEASEADPEERGE